MYSGAIQSNFNISNGLGVFLNPKSYKHLFQYHEKTVQIKHPHLYSAKWFNGSQLAKMKKSITDMSLQ